MFNAYGLDSVLLMVFTQPGCSPCRGIKRQIPETIDSIRSQFNCSFIVTEVDVTAEENRPLVDRYKIQATPTLIVKKNGVVLDTRVGNNGFGLSYWIENTLKDPGVIQNSNSVEEPPD